MKNFLKKLFGRQAVDNTRMLVNVVTCDGKEHYRWAPLPFTIEPLQAIPTCETIGLEKLSGMVIDQIDFFMHNKMNNIDESIYSVYTAADGFQQHYVHSKESLDILCVDFNPIFATDKEALTGVTSIKKVNENSAFCYAGRLYDLVRDRDGKLKVKPKYL